MITQQDFDTWNDLEAFACQLAANTAQPVGADTGYYSDLLFRGQGSHNWSLDTTLQRADPALSRLSEYYRVIAVAQTHIESLVARSWPQVDYQAMVEQLSNYDSLSVQALPHYPYLVYLRHHGFPSPLLDWSRSLYVAAFFAFQQVRAERVAIFAYQEHAGVGKASSSIRPQIHTVGHNIRTHPRHFLQQAEYTAALRFHEGAWHLASHIDVFNTTDLDQDKLWKLTVPATFRTAVLRRLETYNINAYSLFQTEEALLATLANRLLACK